MRKDKSLVRADRILALVRRILGRGFGGDRVAISCWSNGREQGYFIEAFPRFKNGEENREAGVCFAEDRSSDATVVICGPHREFDFQTHQPSDALWGDGWKCFVSDDEAARHIADFLFKTMQPVAAAIAGGVPGESSVPRVR